MAKVVKIRQMTREVISSFKRNDVRIRRKLASKYWKRANHRADQILHAATNYIIDSATKESAALAMEDLLASGRCIAEVTVKEQTTGSGSILGLIGRRRGCSNTRQRGKALRSSRLQSLRPMGPRRRARRAGRGSAVLQRVMPSTGGCCGVGRVGVWMDRDVNAALNLSTRGRSRLDRSLSRPEVKEEGRSQQATSSSLRPRRKGWQVKR